MYDYLLAPPDNIHDGDALIYHVVIMIPGTLHLYIAQGSSNDLITSHSN